MLKVILGPRRFTEDAAPAAALERFLLTGLRHLVVGRDGGYRGILADRDGLVAWSLDEMTLPDRRGGEVLVPAKARAASAEATVHEAARRMLATLAVTHDGRLVGVVTGSDLARTPAPLPDVDEATTDGATR